MYTHEVQNCLSIRALFYLNTAALVYNIIHKNVHSNIVYTKSSTRSTRQSNKQLNPQKARTGYGSSSILTFGAKIFNHIPEDIKRLPHINGFKWALRCHIRNEEFSKMCLSNEFTEKFL